ncbi:hypothetical protein C8R47DRAFT_1073565 [Mycena vitilis]|nr:hypothetical protein C8R47DRAFT_1073565 [Mycena vitilis]
MTHGVRDDDHLCDAAKACTWIRYRWRVRGMSMGEARAKQGRRAENFGVLPPAARSGTSQLRLTVQFRLAKDGEGKRKRVVCAGEKSQGGARVIAYMRSHKQILTRSDPRGNKQTLTCETSDTQDSDTQDNGRFSPSPFGPVTSGSSFLNSGSGVHSSTFSVAQDLEGHNRFLCGGIGTWHPGGAGYALAAITAPASPACGQKRTNPMSPRTPRRLHCKDNNGQNKAPRLFLRLPGANSAVQRAVLLNEEDVFRFWGVLKNIPKFGDKNRARALLRKLTTDQCVRSNDLRPLDEGLGEGAGPEAFQGTRSFKLGCRTTKMARRQQEDGHWGLSLNLKLEALKDDIDHVMRRVILRSQSCTTIIRVKTTTYKSIEWNGPLRECDRVGLPVYRDESKYEETMGVDVKVVPRSGHLSG